MSLSLLRKKLILLMVNHLKCDINGLIARISYEETITRRSTRGGVKSTNIQAFELRMN